MRHPLHIITKAWAERGHERSALWPATRQRWLSGHPSCAACGSTKDVEVHHKKPFHLFPALELDSSNFITLCETMGTEHHLNVGHTVDGKRSWKLFNPNVVQDAANRLSLVQRPNTTPNAG